MSLKYRVSNIAWYNFESLSKTLLKAVIGPEVTCPSPKLQPALKSARYRNAL
jgi:hypothetical protein